MLISNAASRAVFVAGVLCVALVTHGCGQRDSKLSRQSAANGDPRRWNDIARFLAGLEGRADGPFRGFEKSGCWREYSASLNQTWKRVDAEQFQAVDAFERRELAGLRSRGQFVFYPLSGPDVLYATRFFPQARTFVFAGLEPVGDIRSPGRAGKVTLDRELRGWSQAVSTIFERTFFVTSEMDREFRGRVADGLLPMILLLLARSGHSIDQVQYGRLLDSGEFVAEEHATRRHEAVEIRFRGGSENTTRTLFYFSRNLAGDFERNPSFARFLDRLGAPDTLVKSASFLLHWRMCAGLRQYILQNSNLILEDDTGIPYRYFRPPAWTVDLFGAYSRPDRPFRREYQQDLDAAFHEPKRVRQLGFSLGYGSGRRPSSMILARRTQPVPAH